MAKEPESKRLNSVGLTLYIAMASIILSGMIFSSLYPSSFLGIITQSLLNSIVYALVVAIPFIVLERFLAQKDILLVTNDQGD
ncbi:hypothetical protein [Shewanella sp. cp20]|uniref:hypothetical protein n=1 Tax=Shewanella sp. cp20 TaxID=1521167 RepID=UPI00059EE0B4|nr:hypothetical protein [Shewanella sp. cp20]KIO38186.1 hypothetical protein DB48_01135 [Shewanella sp. cp20]